MLFTLVSLLFSTSTAWAGPQFEDWGLVLSAPSSGSFSGGVNAPTVTFDPTTNQYVMFFESEDLSGGIPSDCAQGYSIGRATSTDGVTWTIDATPVLEAAYTDSTSAYHCVVSQPAILFDGTTWHLFFSMAKGKASSTSTSNQPTGIGYATSTDGVTFTMNSAPLISKTGSQAPSMPSAVMYNGVMYVLYAEYPDYKLAWRDTAGTWTVESTSLIDEGEAGDWSDLWIFSPAVVCDRRVGYFPITLILGGDDTSANRSLGIAVTQDGFEWYASLDNPLASDTLDFNSLRHWEVLRAGNELLMWYSVTDSTTGLKAIGFAHDDLDGNGTWARPAPRVCGRR